MDPIVTFELDQALAVFLPDHVELKYIRITPRPHPTRVEANATWSGPNPRTLPVYDVGLVTKDGKLLGPTKQVLRMMNCADYELGPTKQVLRTMDCADYDVYVHLPFIDECNAKQVVMERIQKAILAYEDQYRIKPPHLHVALV